MRTRRWSRRRLLAAAPAAAGLLAGCGPFRDGGPPPQVPDRLDDLLRSTHTLAGRYEATLAAFPDLTELLGPLHATHVAHVAALRELIGRDPASPAASPTGGGPPAVGSDPDAELAALHRAEQDAQQEAAAACLAAPPGRAVLLGTIAAARATHVSVLA